MSAPRTPTKSAGSKSSESKNPRESGSQSGTPPTGSAQRRSAAGSQLGSPVVRSGAASAVSPSGARDKLSSATNKQNAASPVPAPKSATERVEVAENAHFLPPGIHTIFISSTTQQAMQLCVDEDLTQENNSKMIDKEILLNDIQTNGQGSNFYEFQQQIQSYPENEIAIIYDYDYYYSQNFLICFDSKLKKLIENPPVTLPIQESDEVEQYVPPVSKKWISLGSEVEIDNERLVLNRPLKRYKIKVPDRIATTVSPSEKFKDLDPDIERKKNFISIEQCEDKQFELKKMELDLAIQAAPTYRENSAQTIWRYPKNQWTQYEARTLTEEDKIKSMGDPALMNMITNAKDLFSEALQQNIIHDPFYLDWKELGGNLDGLGGPGDSHLKEYQSFSSIKQSRDKVVTCVQWHPTLRGIIAVSLAAGQGFDERTDNLSRTNTSPSLILIWSFVDPIQPKLYLEAPDDIQCFQFSPTDPHVIAGGCINGQVVMWDIKEYEERIKNPRGDHRDKDLFIPGFEDETFFQTPHIRYCAVSSIENGHSEPITDLQWIPDHYQVTVQGLPTENIAMNCSQIITCAFDNQVLFWETRVPRAGVKPLSKKEREINHPMGVPLTFKHLDLIWKPYLRVTMQSPETGMVDFAPRKFSMREIQGDRDVLNQEEKDLFEKKKDPSLGQFVNPLDDPNKSLSQAKAKVLQSVDTFFYIGTEDGQLVYQDWMPQKDQDSTKFSTPKAAWSTAVVDGPVVALKRSPFFKDIILVAGGWLFQIWKEKIHSGALLHAAPVKEKITDAEWSPTRPGVFYISKQNGSVDIWDIIDRTHAPSLSQSISSSAVTFLNIKVISSKQQLLAAGDSNGTLHILEVPWALRQPVNQELALVTNYLERETERRGFVKHRWDLREEEKREKERLASMKAGIAPSHIPTQEEIDIRMKNEFNEFLQFEFGVLREMGLRDENEAPVISSAAT
ncbi:unnamed protein product [Rotaria socialis]|uniref:WD repeat-containing protein 63 n=1 Tax=Rotaria socialis TaxID=392032 RepID=A0A818GMG4_9BILA|nr:unnamed protein product [Rotaria socialis]CAF3334644.1 unnamed protein product [Rotaria socialis]CAF3470252.1 unnamed protein product [Rotaria socialis]CAF3494026.1 unnamed protein product [Rotaria socialis]CAF4087815.1 unnamed protein product [Rotaria socialis]